MKLEVARTLQEAVALVGAAASKHKGGWLRGQGWRNIDWTPAAEPTRHDLDAVTGDIPVALCSRDTHSLWLNSAGLAKAGGADLRVSGGVVEVDEDSQPTGLLKEMSAWQFLLRYVNPTADEYLAAMRSALPVVASRGVVAVHDKDGSMGSFDLWKVLVESGELNTLRVWQSIPHARLDEFEPSPDDEWFRIGYVKVFMDGTIGSQTALMMDSSGVRITSSAELADIVVRSAAKGFPVAAHAIGDLANREALDAFDKTRDAWKGLRPRIEHAQLIDQSDFGRFAELGVACSVQFSHAPSDRDLADEYWKGMTDRSYAYKTLWDTGALVANGSDAPVEELDPLAGILAGVKRTIDDRESWHPEQCVTVEEALRATCVNPAWLSKDENRRGKLVPGHYADLVVLNRDPLAGLDGIEVVATLVGGRWVHNPPPWD